MSSPAVSSSARQAVRSARERLQRMGPALGKCRSEALAYGRCVERQADTLQPQACARDFELLLQCVQQHMRQAPR